MYVGTPDLANAVAECEEAQIVRLPAMPLDATFVQVVRMVVGSQGEYDVGALHRAYGGLMGRLLHVTSTLRLNPSVAPCDWNSGNLPPATSD